MTHRPPRLIGLRPGRATAKPCAGGVILPRHGFVTYHAARRICAAIYQANGGYATWFSKWTRRQIWGSDYWDFERKPK